MKHGMRSGHAQQPTESPDEGAVRKVSCNVQTLVGFVPFSQVSRPCRKAASSTQSHVCLSVVMEAMAPLWMAMRLDQERAGNIGQTPFHFTHAALPCLAATSGKNGYRRRSPCCVNTAPTESARRPRETQSRLGKHPLMRASMLGPSNCFGFSWGCSLAFFWNNK